MGNGIRETLIVLDDNNYALWKVKMLDRLHVKDLELPITSQGVKPDTYVKDDWPALDRKCLGFLREYMDHNVIHHVEACTTAFACWEILRDMYERDTAGQKVSLMRRLGRLKYVDGTSITTHVSTIEHIFNQLNSMGMNFDSETQALWSYRLCQILGKHYVYLLAIQFQEEG